MHSVYVHLVAAQIALQIGGCRFALPAWCVVQVTLSAAGRHASMPRKVSRRYDHKSSQVEIQPFHGEFSHHNYSFSAYERASSKSLLFSAAWHIKRSGSVTSFRPVPSHGLQPHGPTRLAPLNLNSNATALSVRSGSRRGPSHSVT